MKISEILFGDMSNELDYEALYPHRHLPDGAEVTRFAPSPTGFLHLGSLFAALVAERIAHQSAGVFMLRIEDTDKKREVEGAIPEIVRGLDVYDIHFDEGMTDGINEKGSYGPYKQSLRKDIYLYYAIKLIDEGKAYPCFCSEEELSALREEQTSKKLNPGYYGEYARHREINADEVRGYLAKGLDFVIRLKSQGQEDQRFSIDDLIKGKVDMPYNNQDIVILKSDGIPTYHFAHAVDDYLMRTTIVTRGEEWLPSLPIHVELFERLGFPLPKYAHISTIMKLDGSSKRKLSKRKDPEIAFDYYDEQGYLPIAVNEYLFFIANSNFQEFRQSNPTAKHNDYMLDVNNMSGSGAIFDLSKLNDISKDVIARLTAEEVRDYYLVWANTYDKKMYELLSIDKDRSARMFNIERQGEKPRKDIAKWNEVREYLFFYFDDLFDAHELVGEYPSIDQGIIKDVLLKYVDHYKELGSRDEWFEDLKAFGEGLGFTANMKAYKKDPSSYKGNIAMLATSIRLAVTKKANTPDLYEIMTIIGEEKVKERLAKASGLL